MTTRYRRIVASAICCLSLCFAPLVWSQETGNVEKLLTELEREDKSGKLGPLIVFVDGAQRALVRASRESVALGGSRMFCYPEGMFLNRTTAVQIILAEYETNKEHYAPFENASPLDGIVFALLNGLRKTYPCK
jgi:hypothetical protein